MGFLPSAPTWAAALVTEALAPVMAGEELIQAHRERNYRGWPALAEGKLPRLLKQLAGYQAQQKKLQQWPGSHHWSCFSRTRCSAAGTATTLSCCNTGIWIKHPRCPGSRTTTRCIFHTPQQQAAGSTSRQGMSKPSS